MALPSNSWLGPGDLSSHTGEALIDRVGRATDRVWLASPFVSDAFARAMCARLPARRKVDRRLIVALNGSGVESRTLSLPALRRLQAAGFALANVRNLHAKLSIIDSNWALVGSGNLTDAGQKATNVELGVVLDDVQLAQAERFFKTWWAESTPIELSDLREFSRWRKSLPPQQPKPPAPKHGSRLRTPPHQGERKRTGSSEPTQFWAKAFFNTPQLDDPEWWRTNKRVNDGPPENRSGPKYEIGDRLLIYVKTVQVCTAIYEVTQRAEYLPEESNRFIPEDERGRWPWLTRVKHIVSVPVSAGFSADDIDLNPMGLRRGRKHITREQYEIAEMLLAGRSGV